MPPRAPRHALTPSQPFACLLATLTVSATVFEGLTVFLRQGLLLTDKAIRALKPRERPYKVADGRGVGVGAQDDARSGADVCPESNGMDVAGASCVVLERHSLVLGCIMTSSLGSTVGVIGGGIVR